MELLTKQKIKENMKRLKNKWNPVQDEMIRYEFEFDTFDEAINFVNRVADVAEQQNHHPDIHIHYNRVAVEISTHALGGLSQKDFDLAEKIESLDK